MVIHNVMRQTSRGDSVRIYQGILKFRFQIREWGSFVRWINCYFHIFPLNNCLRLQLSNYVKISSHFGLRLRCSVLTNLCYGFKYKVPDLHRQVSIFVKRKLKQGKIRRFWNRLRLNLMLVLVTRTVFTKM